MFLFLALFAMQAEPRFTMNADPGDLYRAEVFRLEPGITAAAAVDGLIGGAVRTGDWIGVLPEHSGVSAVLATGLSGEKIVVLVPPAEGPGRSSHVCRLTQRMDGSIDNTARAMRWCGSFVSGPSYTVHLPAVPITRD